MLRQRFNPRANAWKRDGVPFCTSHAAFEEVDRLVWVHLPDAAQKQPGGIAQYLLRDDKWLQEPLPVQSLAPFASPFWGGRALYLWGGHTQVQDPNGSNGCEGHRNPRVGCDPVIPTRDKHFNDGAVFVPKTSG